jgi:signal transduction histidine kinase
VGHELTANPGARLASLMRRLTEVAEREIAARAGLSVLGQLLDLPADGDLQALLAAVTSCCAAIDAGGFLVYEGGDEGGDLTLRAAVALSALAGPLDRSLASAGPIGEAVSARKPVVAKAHAVPANGLLPAGTRVACAVPLLGRAGELIGVALFGSRSADELGLEELLVVRVAAERAARAIETARLSADLVRAQELARRTSGFRDQVLAIVGHDLRNPLGAIVMSAALLQKRGGLAGWQAKTIDRVRSSTLRMGRIIDDLLSYTRTRLGGGIPIVPRPCDLGDLTRKSVDELRVAHPEAKIELLVEGDLGGEWDGDRLEQVASNLISNAIDHGEDGKPIGLVLGSGPDEVTLEVTNRGEMPREVLDHAFEAFHRGPEQTGRKASGLGLGLYIAREIVRCHGGEIAIHSHDGATRIAMRLPRRMAEEQAGARTGPAR